MNKWTLTGLVILGFAVIDRLLGYSWWFVTLPIWVSYVNLFLGFVIVSIAIGICHGFKNQD